MEDNHAIVPSGSNSLTKAQNLISITNKLLADTTIITKHHWDWWHSLDDTWKKIFNNAISGHTLSYLEDSELYDDGESIFKYGTTESPTLAKLNEILNLEQISYHTVYGWRGDKMGISDLTPIKEFKNLKVLLFGCNKIEDISPISNLQKLQVLMLEYNVISDLSPLKELKNLEYLCCKNNPITESEITELKMSLPNCEIYFN